MKLKYIEKKLMNMLKIKTSGHTVCCYLRGQKVETNWLKNLITLLILILFHCISEIRYIITTGKRFETKRLNL